VVARAPLAVLALKRPEKDPTAAAGAWQPVTGNVDDGEREADAAPREVLEETGLEGRLHDLGLTLRFTPEKGRHAGRPVEERVFVLEAASRDVELSREHEAYAWLTPEEAIARYPFAHQKEATRRALQYVLET